LYIALPTVVGGVDQEVCFGDAVTLLASGAITYFWDNAVFDGVNFIPAIGSNDFIVIGTDGNGCSNADTVTVLVNTLPAVNAGTDQIVCPSSLITLNATGANTYAWDFGVVNNVGFIQTGSSIDYIVTGTDVNGCNNTDTVNVSLLAKPTVVGELIKLFV